MSIHSPQPKTLLILTQVYVPTPAAVGQQLSDAAAEMVRRGWRVAVLTSERGYDDPSIKCAVRWMRRRAAKLRIDLDRIGLIGGSAGGHLALMVAYSSDVPELEGDGGHPAASSRVQVVAALYGPTDLTAGLAIRSGIVRDFLGGKRYADAPDLYEQASPIHHVTLDDPPTLLLHGTIGRVVPISQADALAKKRNEPGVPHRYDRLEGWPHAMDLSEEMNRHCRQRMNEFFDQHLAKSEERDDEGEGEVGAKRRSAAGGLLPGRASLTPNSIPDFPSSRFSVAPGNARPGGSRTKHGSDGVPTSASYAQSL